MKSGGWGLTVLRLVVGLVFVMYGGQKIFVFGLHQVGSMFAGLGIRTFCFSR
jgi:uncharacterized membrane protein YphA (DoxX/SURF4 family)